jgi:hypothetical protein
VFCRFQRDPGTPPPHLATRAHLMSVCIFVTSPPILFCSQSSTTTRTEDHRCLHRLQLCSPLTPGRNQPRRSHHRAPLIVLVTVVASPSPRSRWSITDVNLLAAVSPELLIGTLGNPFFSSFRSQPSDLDRLVQIEHLTEEVLDDLVHPDLIKSYGSYSRSTRTGTDESQCATCRL